MKKLLLLILLIISFVFVINAAKYDKREMFNPKDTCILGIKLDMEKNKMEETIGKPIKVKKEFEGAFGEDVLYYSYIFGTVRLEPLDSDKYSISSIVITKPNYLGPRGIKINDSITSVLEKFPYNKQNTIENDTQITYGEFGGNYGFILFDENGKAKRIFYKYGGDGFGGYTLRLDILDNKVTRIGVSVTNI